MRSSGDPQIAPLRDLTAGVTRGAQDTEPSRVVFLRSPFEGHARNESGVYWYLGRSPRLARDAAGLPVFSLTPLLSRMPAPHESALRPLIQSGVLNMEVTLEPDRGDLPPPPAGVILRPLFATRVGFAIEQMVGQTPKGLCEAEAIGPNARAAISCMLSGEHTLAVLDALKGTATSLRTVARVQYEVPTEQSVTLEGLWSEVFDAFTGEFPGPHEYTLSDVRFAFAQAVRRGMIRIRGAESATSAELIDAAFPAFRRQASVILDRVGEATDDATVRFRLSARPHSMFRLEASESRQTNVVRTIELTATLEEILGGTLDGHDGNRFVRAIGPGGEQAPFQEIPRQVRAAVNAHDRGGSDDGASVAVVNNQAMTLSSMLRPTVKPSLAASISAARPGLATALLDDITLNLVDIRPVARRLPAVDDPAAPLWRDRVNPNTLWYAPQFQIVTPAATDVPATAAFECAYERIGVGSDGQPALNATIRLTLRPAMSVATRDELARRGNPPAQPVPISTPSCVLFIPYVDGVDGQIKKRHLFGTIEPSGSDFVAIFE